MAPSNPTSSEALDANLIAQFSADSAVTLIVGQDEQKMIAHEIMLTRDSDFFAAAMKK